MKRSTVGIILVAMIACPLWAADVAVFPVQGVNTDKSFCDAFGTLLAIQYGRVSGQNVIAPNKSAKAVGADSNLTAAAQSLGVSEYIEITAVGLYLSSHEKNNVVRDSAANGNQIIVVTRNEESSSKSDQELLDNSKTLVTATRYSTAGSPIYKVELTLLTYGDIEEATKRFATSLFNKISTEDSRAVDNITRREGMGNNKLFVDKLKGIKVCGVYPIGWDNSSSTISSIGGIGFDMRMEAEKFFLEFGVGARIPSEMSDQAKPKYGGISFELGGSYYLYQNQIVGLYSGIGIIPGFNLANINSDGPEMNLAPYLQIGIMMPRMSSVRFYFDVRVAQHIMPVTTLNYTNYGVSTYDAYGNFISGDTQVKRTDHPTEVGINVGIAW
jgi:hypothetical protein